MKIAIKLKKLREKYGSILYIMIFLTIFYCPFCNLIQQTKEIQLLKEEFVKNQTMVCFINKRDKFSAFCALYNLCIAYFHYYTFVFNSSQKIFKIFLH